MKFHHLDMFWTSQSVMKTDFQLYNSKSDEELIELSVGNPTDANMARTVLEYRKYRETKRQNRLSFGLAILVAFIAFCQFTITAFNFVNSDTYNKIFNPTPTATFAITATPNSTYTPTTLPLLTSTLLPSRMPTP